MNAAAAIPTVATGDALSPSQRRAMVAVVVAVHAIGVYALMQLGVVRDAVREAAPMFVAWIAPPAPPTTPPAPPPAPRPQPTQKKPPQPTTVIAAAPSPAPAAFAVPMPPAPEPVVTETPPVPPAAVVAAPAQPAPPAAPQTIPASAVRYLEPPVLEYPRLSRRNHESGRVTVRVYIDTGGLPRTVQVSQSSGFGRLDDAAVSAVQKARFKPYTENGQPIAGWAVIPLDFNLEK
jgi:protein TonB